MLATREKISACLPATPSLPIFALCASHSTSMLAAEAGLAGPHQRTRWARAGVTRQRTWMGARRSRLGATLPTRMRSQTGDGFRIHLLAAPAEIEPWLVCKRRVASRASPSGGLVGRGVFVLDLGLVGVPFPDTVKMSDSPACRTRPDPGFPNHFVCADYALVVSICDVLLNSSREICCRGFGHPPPGRS
jgi:hypothetical protein